jgi:hypothetical protein
MKRTRYFELKCLELEEQLEVAQKAKAQLREELLTSYQGDGVRQREDGIHGDALQGTLGRTHERQWPGIPAQSKSQTLLGASQRSSSSRRRTENQRGSLSPVQEEPYKEMLDSPPRVADAISPHVSSPSSTGSPGGRSSVAASNEMQKLLDMCTRLRSEDDSLPKAEIDSLNDLVKQLANLMDRRREHFQGPQQSNEDPEYAVPAFIETLAGQRREGEGSGLEPGQHVQSFGASEVDLRHSANFDSSSGSRTADSRLDRSLQSEVNAPERAGNDVVEYEMRHSEVEGDPDRPLQANHLDGSGRASPKVKLQAMERMVPVPMRAAVATMAAPLVLPPGTAAEQSEYSHLGFARYAHLTAPTDGDELSMTTPMEVFREQYGDQRTEANTASEEFLPSFGSAPMLH